jgi:hypothetical protein
MVTGFGLGLGLDFGLDFAISLLLMVAARKLELPRHCYGKPRFETGPVVRDRSGSWPMRTNFGVDTCALLLRDEARLRASPQRVSAG